VINYANYTIFSNNWQQIGQNNKKETFWDRAKKFHSQPFWDSPKKVSLAAVLGQAKKVLLTDVLGLSQKISKISRGVKI